VPSALEEVRDGVEPEAVEPEVEPVRHHPQHLVGDGRVLVVEIGLMREEETGASSTGRQPGPTSQFRRLGVDEDHARVGSSALSESDHTYQSRYGELGSRRDSWNHGCSIDVWFNTRVGDHSDAALVRSVDERREVLRRPVVGVHREEVGNVVAGVAQRRRVHREQPDAVEAEPLQVVEPFGEGR